MQHQWVAVAVAVIIVLLAASPFIRAPESPPAPPETSWEKAKREGKEAADAVGEAAREAAVKTWDGTKRQTREALDAAGEASKGAWDATKENAKRLWQSIKDTVLE